MVLQLQKQLDMALISRLLFSQESVVIIYGQELTFIKPGILMEKWSYYC